MTIQHQRVILAQWILFAASQQYDEILHISIHVGHRMRFELDKIGSRHYLNVAVNFLIWMSIFLDVREFAFEEIDRKYFISVHAGRTRTETGEYI